MQWFCRAVVPDFVPPINAKAAAFDMISGSDLCVLVVLCDWLSKEKPDRHYGSACVEIQVRQSII